MKFMPSTALFLLLILLLITGCAAGKPQIKPVGGEISTDDQEIPADDRKNDEISTNNDVSTVVPADRDNLMQQFEEQVLSVPGPELGEAAALPVDPAEPQAGGFINVETDTPLVLRAFDFLCTELAVSHPQLVIGEIRAAFSRVVAGINLKLFCTYTTADSGTEKILSAVIYHSLEWVPQEIISLELE